MTRISFVVSFFFLLFLHSCIYISFVSATTTTTVRQPSGEDLLAASNTCPARLFSFDDPCPSEESQEEECMYHSVYRAAARLHPLLRSSSSAAVRATPTSLQQQQKRTMSSDASSSTTPQNNAEKPQEQQQQQEQQRPTLGLPAPEAGDDVSKLDVSGGGSTISLDHLGPVVVNQDGTMSRIANWDKMTDIEKRNTLRVLGKRNRERMEALKAAGVQPGEKPQAGEGTSA
ncbi:hypothetical protein VTN77DRAFT_6041 [Rasamsonia byssochlamydoides]|uniref:uncharacterized protein n=1 Tax=Rasamsonia byssochlamydoides TaxID=89139 RepID=UPI00374200D0